MAQVGSDALKAKPQANVYTVLLIVAILALGVTIGLVLHNLLSPPPAGYGLDIGALFDSEKALKDLPQRPKLPTR